MMLVVLANDDGVCGEGRVTFSHCSSTLLALYFSIDLSSERNVITICSTPSASAAVCCASSLTQTHCHLCRCPPPKGQPPPTIDCSHRLVHLDHGGANSQSSRFPSSDPLSHPPSLPPTAHLNNPELKLSTTGCAAVVLIGSSPPSSSPPRLLLAPCHVLLVASCTA